MKCDVCGKDIHFVTEYFEYEDADGNHMIICAECMRERVEKVREKWAKISGKV